LDYFSSGVSVSFSNLGISFFAHSILVEYASRNCGEVMGFPSWAAAAVRLLNLLILALRFGFGFLIGL